MQCYWSLGFTVILGVMCGEGGSSEELPQAGNNKLMGQTEMEELRRWDQSFINAFPNNTAHSSHILHLLEQIEADLYKSRREALLHNNNPKDEISIRKKLPRFAYHRVTSDKRRPFAAVTLLDNETTAHSSNKIEVVVNDKPDIKRGHHHHHHHHKHHQEENYGNYKH